MASFFRGQFTGLRRLTRLAVGQSLSYIRQGLIRATTPLVSQLGNAQLQTYLSFIESDLRRQRIPDYVTNNGRFTHELAPTNFRNVTVRNNQLITYDIQLIDSGGRSLRIRVRSAYGRRLTESELDKAIHNAVWRTEGENVLGTGLRPTSWLRNTSRVIVPHITQFLR